MSYQGTSKERDDVIAHHYGKVDKVDNHWPSGEFLISILEKEGVGLAPHEQVPQYWHTSARWALLRKFGLIDASAKQPSYRRVDGKTRIVMGDEEIESINAYWENVQAHSEKNDLVEFINTSRSNNRQLQWTTLNVKAGYQFKLHAHPNIELIFAVRGALHGIRMQGDPIVDYQPIPDDETRLKGPNLQQLDRSWRFETIPTGEWLVNENGSIHKSFTATSGNGALLLILWGGSHADIAPGEDPRKVDVHAALDTMDRKVGECRCHDDWTKISETFLPDSERSIQ